MSLLDIYKAKNIGAGIKVDDLLGERYGIVDLGSLTWKERTSGSQEWYAASPNDSQVPATNGINAICKKYKQRMAAGLASDKEMVVNTTSFSSSSKYILIKDTSYSTASDFTAALSGVYLVYELATA